MLVVYQRTFSHYECRRCSKSSFMWYSSSTVTVSHIVKFHNKVIILITWKKLYAHLPGMQLRNSCLLLKSQYAWTLF
uniref:Uncharacterized protein n=1 Tax=Arundo donax TaxID=35708 RepID=A0A0A8Z4U3_ARUDO